MTTAWSDAEPAEGWLTPFDPQAPLWEVGTDERPNAEQWTSPLREWTDPALAEGAEHSAPTEQGPVPVKFAFEQAWSYPGPESEPELGDEHLASLFGESMRHARRPPEAEEETAGEAEEGVVTERITEALDRKDWPVALQVAIKEGWRDENKLTNLVFFARHPDLGGRPLKPKDPEDAKLIEQWVKVHDNEVWPAIRKAAKNDTLAVDGALAADGQTKFWGKSGKRFKTLVERAAKQVDINPGLLASTLLAEEPDRRHYLTNEKVSSYRIGVDDFYKERERIRRRVPAYRKIGWDERQTPVVHLNDARKPREVATIFFDSGPDALLASAVYLKYGETLLREWAAQRGEDFHKLPIEIRFALTRIAFAGGVGTAKNRLERVLDGGDILVRKNLPSKIYQTDRNATIRTAQALHLSEWIFRVPAQSAPAGAPESGPTLDEPETFASEMDRDLKLNLAVPDTDVRTEWEGEALFNQAGMETDTDTEAAVEILDEEIFHREPQPSLHSTATQFEISTGHDDESSFEEAEGLFDKATAAARHAWDFFKTRMRIANGVVDQNRLTNLVFFDRHPKRANQPLARGDADFAELSAEWLEIRDRIVRPALLGAGPQPRYNRSGALEYARKFWLRPCDDQFIALHASSGRKFAKVDPGAKFEHDFESDGITSRGSERAVLPDGSHIPWVHLDDCTHFISCCIGERPGEPCGGLKLTYQQLGQPPTAPYGITRVRTMVEYLTGRLRANIKYATIVAEKSEDETLIGRLSPGDLIAYFNKERKLYSHMALLLEGNKIACHTYGRSDQPECTWDNDWLIGRGAYQWTFIRFTV